MFWLGGDVGQLHLKKSRWSTWCLKGNGVNKQRFTITEQFRNTGSSLKNTSSMANLHLVTSSFPSPQMQCFCSEYLPITFVTSFLLVNRDPCKYVVTILIHILHILLWLGGFSPPLQGLFYDDWNELRNKLQKLYPINHEYWLVGLTKFEYTIIW